MSLRLVSLVGFVVVVGVVGGGGNTHTPTHRTVFH
jgi:hypothetical protein